MTATGESARMTAMEAVVTAAVEWREAWAYEDRVGCGGECVGPAERKLSLAVQDYVAWHRTLLFQSHREFDDRWTRAQTVTGPGETAEEIRKRAVP